MALLRKIPIKPVAALRMMSAKNRSGLTPAILGAA
jgi:hypothetical protein